MTGVSKYLLFSVFFVIVIQVSFAATMLINSGDWRTTYLGIMYGVKKDYDILIISSLGDADIFSKALPKNSSIVIFENTKNGIIHDAKKFFELNGFTNVSEIEINDPLEDQLNLAKELNDTCYIVVPSAFTIDSETAAPYALVNNCTVLLWDYKHSSGILSFLRGKPQEDIIFFGDIEERPWVLFPNATVISGGPYEINKKIVKKVLDYYKQKNETSSWAILVKGDSLELGYLIEKLPILAYSGDVKEIVDFMLKNKIYHLEVIGPDMMDIASKIRDSSHKKIGVVVKFGRTFTGIPSLRGKVFPLNVIIGDLPYPHLDVYGIYLDTSGKLLVVFKNDGNTRALISVPALNIKSDGKQLASLSDTEVYKILPGQYLPLPFNISSGDYRNVMAYLYAIYNQDKPLSKHVGDGTPPVAFNITMAPLFDDSNVSVVDARYFLRSGKIVVRVKNLGDDPVYVYGQLMNFSYGNETVVMAPVNYTLIQPGKVGQLEFPMFLSDTELLQNENVSVKLFYGKRYPLLVNTHTFTVELGMYSQGFLDVITGMFIAVLASPVFYVVIVLAILVAILWKKGRKPSKVKKSRKRRKGFVRL